MPAQSEPVPDKEPLLSGLSFLAPAALAILPALAFAFAPVSKDENYEWAQHRLTAVVFAATFVFTLFRGPWQRNWLTILASLLTVGTVTWVVLSGLPEAHWLFVLTGALVGLGYHFSLRPHPPSWTETIAVGFSSALCFWATSRLLWWQSFDAAFASGSTRLLFVAAAGIPIYVLYRITGADAKSSPSTKGYGIDILTLVILAVAVLRTNSLTDNPDFPHHWGVFTVPAELVREGYTLLGQVPSQYGFLSTLLLATLPTEDRFTALFWLNSSLIWASGVIVYGVLRTWLSCWWWKVSAAFISIASVALICGGVWTLSGPMAFPSVGAIRFIWVEMLLGFLLWHHLVRAKPASDQPPSPSFLWIGSSLWLVGVFWSIESAVYVTAAWLPAASLLCTRPPPERESRAGRLTRLLGGIARMSRVTGFLFVTAILLIEVFYRIYLGRSPVWSAYWEYAAAFAADFGAMAIDPQGAVWTLLLLHGALLAAVVSVDFDRQRSSLALIWAAWGTLWTISTYYISRSHANNIINLIPLLLLIISLLVHALRSADLHYLARPWLWLTAPPFVGTLFWLVLTQPAALRHQISDYSIEPHASRLLKPAPRLLRELIADCVKQQPGPYAVVAYSTIDTIQVDHPPGEPTWLPLSSLPLFYPLPEETRFAYADIYTNQGQKPGWLIAPVKRDHYSLQWVFNYANSRYAPALFLSNSDWEAWYLVPRSK